MATYSSKSAATTSYGTVSSLKITIEEGSRTCNGFWKWSKSHTSGFTVRWDYKNVDGVWVLGNSSTVTVGQTNKPTGSSVCDTYDAPDDAYAVRVYVKPVSSTRSITYYTSTKKTTTKTATVAYFTSKGKTSDSKVVGVVLDAPSISAEYLATNKASLTMVSTDYNYAILRYQDGAWKNVETSAHVRIPDSNTRFDNSRTSYTDSSSSGRGLVSGHSYKYATRAYTTNTSGTRYWGEYSDFSDQVDAKPCAPSDFSVAAKGSDGDYYFKATWSSGSSYSGNNEYYHLRWSQTKSLISAGTGCKEAEDIESTSYTPEDFIDDISAPWYFAVRAENNGGDAVSSWTYYAKTISFGERPEAPTVGSVPSYAEEGATITITWTHNTVDGSDQTAWYLQGSTTSGSAWFDVAKSDDDTATATSYAYTVGTYWEEAGDTIRFRLRTAGATAEYSEYTQTADVSIIAVLQLSCSVAATVESLPVEFVLTSNLEVRAWQLDVTAAETYETTAIDGDEEVVAAGARVFTTQLTSGDSGFGTIAATVSAGTADCEVVDGATYTATATAISIYGTTATDEEDFYVNFSGEQPEPTMVALYDEEAYEVHLYPECRTWDEDEDEDEDEGTLTETVTMDVYRRDPNGDLLTIAEDVENSGAVEIVDTHCNFGTATYRVRAVDSETGMVGFMDVEVETAQRSGIVLQFEDGYRQYTGSDDAAQDETGIIELPYNTTISESYSPDSSLVEYIGNSEPTLYTGTQRGATVTSTAQAIKVTDSDTIDKLRRYAGSVSRVYYRDSTGLSFWAWATVTLTHAYNDAAVDCSLSLTRILGDYTASQTTEVS